MSKDDTNPPICEIVLRNITSSITYPGIRIEACGHLLVVLESVKSNSLDGDVGSDRDGHKAPPSGEKFNCVSINAAAFSGLSQFFPKPWVSYSWEYRTAILVNWPSLNECFIRKDYAVFVCRYGREEDGVVHEM